MHHVHVYRLRENQAVRALLGSRQASGRNDGHLVGESVERMEFAKALIEVLAAVNYIKESKSEQWAFY